MTELCRADRSWVHGLPRLQAAGAHPNCSLPRGCSSRTPTWETPRKPAPGCGRKANQPPSAQKQVWGVTGSLHVCPKRCRTLKKKGTNLEQQSSRCSRAEGRRLEDTALRMRAPSRCGSRWQRWRMKWRKGGLRLVTRRRDARVVRLGSAWPYACAARMDQEEVSATRPVGQAGGRTRRYVRGCARMTCSPREREGQARYACARELGSRGKEAERRRRGGGGRAPLRYRAWGRGRRRRRLPLTAPASFSQGPAFLCLHRGGARSIWGWVGSGKGRRMETGRDLELWGRPRPASRQHDLQRGWRAEKPGEGLGAPGRSLRDAPGRDKAAPGPEGPAIRVGVTGMRGCGWSPRWVFTAWLLWGTVEGRVAMRESPPGTNFPLLSFLGLLGLSRVPMVTASLPAAVSAWLLGGLFCLETLGVELRNLEVRDLGVQPALADSQSFISRLLYRFCEVKGRDYVGICMKMP